MVELIFPSPFEKNTFCSWSGDCFDHGSLVLEYPMPRSPIGWNDQLTDFHEQLETTISAIDKASYESAFEQCSIAVNKLLKNYKPVILEIGCLSGHLLRKLRKSFPDTFVCGADIIDKPLQRLAENLKQEGIPTPLLRFDLVDCPLPNDSVDVCLALNVLEHIENDKIALQEIYRILKNDGVFIFEVPNSPSLFDDYDRELFHYRRYKADSLNNILIEIGFKKIKSSYLGVFLYPPFFVIKKIRRFIFNIKNIFKSINSKKTKINKKVGPSPLTAKLIILSSCFFCKYLLAIELYLGKFVRWPFGIRCLGAYKK
ncbi:MAG: class I SAM-dependent methyltransferase [Deltaproteobacteria bacterium]|jgi:SAM-dependent methyltransferase|nr:class I SAM-dependent methyltransferase [Deltaproteobacteria bacterium]